MVLNFGSYINRTFEWILNNNQNYCRWILTQPIDSNKNKYNNFGTFRKYVLSNEKILDENEKISKRMKEEILKKNEDMGYWEIPYDEEYHEFLENYFNCYVIFIDRYDCKVYIFTKNDINIIMNVGFDIRKVTLDFLEKWENDHGRNKEKDRYQYIKSLLTHRLFYQNVRKIISGIRIPPNYVIWRSKNDENYDYFWSQDEINEHDFKY